jgi:hypothetical protein
MNDKEIKKFLPGFTMGIVRAAISHPFEMLKLKSQMGIQSGFYQNLHKGIHLSILSNSLERGIQFYFFEKFKKDNSLFYSSFLSSTISTSISLPYNIALLRKNVLKTELLNINRSIILKSGSLEYLRNITGSTIFLYCYDMFKSFDFPIYASSILSGTTVWLITYPIDNIKNQIIAKKQISYNIPLLYKGIQYPILRGIPSASIGMYVYEYVKQYVDTH